MQADKAKALSAILDSPEGFVYVVLAPGIERWKFGFTSTTIKRRLEGIQYSCPVEILLYGKFQTHEPRKLEQKILRYLLPWKSRGEWFVDSPEVRCIADLIRDNKEFELRAFANGQKKFIKRTKTLWDKQNLEIFIENAAKRLNL